MPASTVVSLAWSRKHLTLNELLALSQTPSWVDATTDEELLLFLVHQQGSSHGFLKHCGLVQDFSLLQRHPLHLWKDLKAMGKLTDLASQKVEPDLAISHWVILLFRALLFSPRPKQHWLERLCVSHYSASLRCEAIWASDSACSPKGKGEPPSSSPDLHHH